MIFARLSHMHIHFIARINCRDKVKKLKLSLCNNFLYYTCITLGVFSLQRSRIHKHSNQRILNNATMYTNKQLTNFYSEGKVHSCSSTRYVHRVPKSCQGFQLVPVNQIALSVQSLKYAHIHQHNLFIKVRY